MNTEKQIEQIILRPLLAMHYSPRIFTCHVRCRSKHSLLYILEGEYEYRSPRLELRVGAGAWLYLPQGAGYTYTVLTKRARCLQVEFDALMSGENIRLAKQPMVLTKTDRVESAFRELVAQHNLQTDAGYYRAVGLLYELFSYLMVQAEPVEPAGSKIASAEQYIRANLNRRISVDTLASLCYMSQSQLRRLFQKEHGMSPIAYKNHLRMERAAELLTYGSMRIGEVANTLGFDSVFAFSKMFKKQTGVSPSEFLSKHESSGPA